MEVVTAAGLLHDVARDKPRHAEAGVELLFSLGYPEVAEVVKAHMDIAVSEQSAISAQEVLYLADKLVEGSRVMPLEKRLRAKLGRYAEDSEAKEGLIRRMNNAVKIRGKIEAVTGRSLQEILAETEGVAVPNGFDNLSSAAR
jgi:HD superfamily phosphohydrolase YqeK